METAAANSSGSGSGIDVELLLRRLRSLNVLVHKQRGDKQAILEALKTLRLFALNSWPTNAQLLFVRAVLLRLIPRTFQGLEEFEQSESERASLSTELEFLDAHWDEAIASYLQQLCVASNTSAMDGIAGRFTQDDAFFCAFLHCMNTTDTPRLASMAGDIFSSVIARSTKAGQECTKALHGELLQLFASTLRTDQTLTEMFFTVRSLSVLMTFSLDRREHIPLQLWFEQQKVLNTLSIKSMKIIATLRTPGAIDFDKMVAPVKDLLLDNESDAIVRAFLPRYVALMSEHASRALLFASVSAAQQQELPLEQQQVLQEKILKEGLFATLLHELSHNGGVCAAYPLSEAGVYLADALAALCQLECDFSLLLANPTEGSPQRLQAHARDQNKLDALLSDIETTLPLFESLISWVCSDMRSKPSILSTRDQFHPPAPLTEANGHSFIACVVNTSASALCALASLTSCPAFARLLSPDLHTQLQNHFLVLLESCKDENGDMRTLIVQSQSGKRTELMHMPSSLESCAIALRNLQVFAGLDVTVADFDQRLRSIANRAKERGNARIALKENAMAAACYTTAIRLTQHSHEHIVFVANRSEALLRLKTPTNDVMALDDAERALRSESSNDKYARRRALARKRLETS